MEHKQVQEGFRSALLVLSDLFASVDESKINAIPFEGSWTIGQLMDHVIKAVSAKIFYGNAEKTERGPEEKFETIAAVFLDFSTKMKSPDFIDPVLKLYDKELLISRLNKRLAEIQEAVQIKDLELTYTGFILPGLGAFTGVEWLYFYSCHIIRHTHQLRHILFKLEAA